MRKLFIGNLPWSATPQDLRNLFSECGTVEAAKIVTDRDTNKSKGFGFVVMATEEEAQSALQMDQFKVGGRPIKVELAKQDDRTAYRARNPQAED